MNDLKSFLNWLNMTGKPVTPERLNWNAWRSQPGLQGINQNSLQEKFIAIVADFEHSRGYDLNFEGWTESVSLAGTDPTHTFFHGLQFSSGYPISLSKLGFGKIFLHGSPTVELVNVWVEELSLRACGSIKLTNCRIGSLVLMEVAARTFEMSGGVVLGIDCAPPSGTIPFTGSVYFDRRVYFSRAPGPKIKGPQPYRNMRAHMLKLENTPMVSLFHTLEQATERKMERWGFHRAISALYEYLSDYGSSALRPVIFFVGLFALTFLLVLVFDGAVHANVADLAGWQETLIGDDWFARARRAFVLTGQATLNPLGVFGVKGLLVAKSGLLALWLSVHGLLSTIFVALFIFAIRRRFKMN